MKAGVVGVDRVYRGFRYQKNKTEVAIKTGMIALATIALYAYNRLEHGDEYDELPDWDRDLHWHVWIAGEHFRIPKPWEIGGIATISERALEGVLDENPRQARKILRVIREMFRYDVIPQAAEPWIEQWANKQFFFDRPIEPQYLEQLPPWMRATPYTSRTLRELGEATRNLPRGLQLPPARVEHLLRGFFNTWAAYGLTLADQAFYDDIPSLRLDEYPGLRTILRQQPARGTRFRTLFYDMLREATEARRGMRHADRSYRPEFADEIEQEFANRAYAQLQWANRQAQAINRELNRALDARDLDQVRQIANELGKEPQFASKIAKLRQSKHWSRLGTLKRELVNLWLAERNQLFETVIKDIEAQREKGR